MANLDDAGGNSTWQNDTNNTNSSLQLYPPDDDRGFDLELEVIHGLTIPVYGFISPFLVLFTLITNTLVCVVLLRKNMRSPTNALLVAMAISDMLTGVWTIPCFVYFFTLGHYKEYVPYEW